jgi:hypothetical protein
MKIYGGQLLNQLAELKQLKAVMNMNGAIFFPIDQQHSSMKMDGISYEDDYRGNALAAIVTPSKIEIRFHTHFSPELVITIIRSIKAQEEAALLRSSQVYYQGKRLLN